MASLRRNLRVFAMTWLVFQGTWLAALVPRDCCAAHRPAEPGCHRSAEAAHCPMRAADGRPCPMHRGPVERSTHQSADARHDHQSGASEHGDETPRPVSRCRLTAGCDGPMSALFALLSNHGILPESGAALPSGDSRSVPAAVHESLIRRFVPPDPPPPRA